MFSNTSINKPNVKYSKKIPTLVPNKVYMK